MVAVLSEVDVVFGLALRRNQEKSVLKIIENHGFRSLLKLFLTDFQFDF